MATIIQPITIDATNLDSTNIAVDSDDAVYGADWMGLWVTGTTYAADDVVYLGIELYQSIAGSNTGNNPTTTNDLVSATPKWLSLGKINQYRMFDEYVNSLTQGLEPDSVADSTIEVIIAFDATIDRCALFQVSGTTVDFVIKNQYGTETWSDTVNLIQDLIHDWEEYFFAPLPDLTEEFDFIEKISTLEVSGTLEVTITNPYDVAKCGFLIIGKSTYVGDTQNGVSPGFISSGKKEQDSYLRTYLSPGNIAKIIKCDLAVLNSDYDKVQKIMIKYDSTAIVFDGNSDSTSYEALIAYCFVKSFYPVLNDPGLTICALELEGLI